MADNDFFNKEENKVESQNQETIKLGEKEYTQDELQKLVGLGEIATEAEQKYNITIDKVWPNLQTTINEKMKLEGRLEELEKAKNTIPPSEEQLSEQQIAQKAKEELAKLGYVSKDEVSRIVNDTIQGYRLLDEVQGVITEQTANGNPSTDSNSLLKHMEETGIRNPEKAYKDMFEQELDAIKEKKLASLKQPGLVTENSSNAGSKEPAPQKITKENLDDALRAALRGQ